MNMTTRIKAIAGVVAVSVLLGLGVAQTLSVMKLETFAVLALAAAGGLWCLFRPRDVVVMAVLLLPFQYYKQFGNVYVTNTFALSLFIFAAVVLLYRQKGTAYGWIALPFTLVLAGNAFRGVDAGESASLALGYVGGLLLLYGIIYTKPRPETLTVSLVASGTVFSLWHIVTYFSSQAFAFTDPYQQKRIIGDAVGNANILGIYLAVIAVLSLAFVLDRRYSFAVKVAGLLVFIVNLLGVAVTLSRSAWLGVAVATAILALRSVRRVGPLLTGIGALGWLLTLLPSTSFQVRLLSLLNMGSDSAITDRLLGWRSAWLIIRENPVFGIGFPNFRYRYYLYLLPGSKDQLYHAHNIFLTFWAELGIVGLLSFVLIIGMLLWLFRKVAPEYRDFAAVVLGGIGVILVAGMTEHSFNGQHVIFVFYTLVAMYLLTIRRDVLPEVGGNP